MSSRDGLSFSSNPKMIEITIQRCSNVSTDEPTRSYFVKVTIGDESVETEDRKRSKGQVVWNQKFGFEGVEASSMTLSLYRRRMLPFVEPKLVGEDSIRLPETHGTEPQITPGTLSFRHGERIEYILAVNWTIGGGQPEQPGRLVVVGDSDAHDASREAEHQESAPEDDSGGLNSPASEINEGIDRTGDAIKQALQVLQPLDGEWKQLVEGLGFFCQITKGVAEVHPFAQLIHRILSTISAPLTAQLERDERLGNLLNSFTRICDVIKDPSFSAVVTSNELRDVLKRISLQMTDAAYFVSDYCGGNFLKEALKNTVSEVDDTIEEYTGKVEELKEELRLRLAFQTGTVVKRVEVSVIRVLERIEQLSQSLDLGDFAYAKGAGFNADYTCLTGTRTEPLKDMAEWISSNSSRVLLLLGGAGTGKSAIMHSVASQFKDLGRLGSMFCFSESEKTARKPTTLFSHIARDLAELDKNIRQKLFKAAPTIADRTTSSIKEQFEKFVLAPANAIREKLHGPIVIVIDALDESGSVKERRGLLEIMASRLKELPPNFRIIISSRPYPDIEKKFLDVPEVVIKRMDNISRKSTDADIVTYVNKELEGVVEINSEMRQSIASHASGLFEWARAGCDFIRSDRPGESPLSRYETIIHPLKSDTRGKIGGDTLLDELYHTVLSKVLSPNEEAMMEVFKFVMARVLGTFEPLSCNSLNRFFQVSGLTRTECKAESIVGYLGSLLSGVDKPDAPVVPFHTSFRDFLTSAKRSKEFFVDPRATDIHLDMALSTLSIMAENLKFNICQLETSYLANKDVPDLDDRIKKYIPPHLLYACRFWCSHLCALPTTLSDYIPDGHSPSVDNDWAGLMKKLDEVLSRSLLYWLEVLSLTNTVSIGVRQLRQLSSWIKKTSYRAEELGSLIEDVVQFSSHSAKCIARSAPHIYVSALPFAPRRSLVAKEYMKPDDKTLSVTIGERESYPPCLNILQGHTDSVSSVAFSPDGSQIVSGSHDRTIRIWNAEDSTMALEPFQDHTSPVLLVAFSPDGSRVVSCSYDSTIRVWNAEDGIMALEPFQGHSDLAISAAFSPDGSQIVSCSDDGTISVWNAEDGTIVLKPFQGHTNLFLSVAFSPDGSRIVSGSSNGTIQVWNAEDGTMALEPFRGHTDSVTSIAFSPNGSQFVSGSDDCTIRVWNVKDGALALEPFRGHTGSVLSVAFSPDGSRIVSGSDDITIRVWNAEDGTMALGPFQGHTSPVLSVAFSPDGSRVVSGSDDCTIRVWSAEDGTMALEPFNGHTSVWSAAFSPNGSQIVSASDGTIRVWNAEDGTIALELFQGYNSSIWSVAFSPDGSRIVSGSSDGTIRVWDAEHGTMALEPSQGYTSPVWSVAISPDGSQIISGYADGTIRVWNVEDGTMALEPFRDHTDSVRSVAFSPDGSRIGSGSDDCTIRVWNVEDGTMALEPFQGHTNSVRSVAFSPNGSRIVSGSSDGTIRVWNAEDGTMALEPLQGHTSPVWSVAFSPDGSRIVSGSYDCTIRVWSAEDGTMALEPFQGHTSSIWSVAFSPDGSRILSCSSDGTIRVWDVEHGTMALESFRGHTSLITPALSSSAHLHTLTTTSVILNYQNPHSIPCPSSDLPISSPTSRPPLATIVSAGDILSRWKIEDGWSLGPHQELLFYVPPVHRPGLWGPRTTLVISKEQTKLDISRFAHGSDWMEAFSSGTTK